MFVSPRPSPDDASVAEVGEISRQNARLRLVVAPDEVDLVSGELWALGTLGIEEQPGESGVVLYAGFGSAVEADRVAGALGRFAVLEEVGATDHLDDWREHATVYRAGNRIVVRPPWVPHDVEPVELVLHIEPGHSFGSGSHTSTRLVLAELERTLEGGERVLDVGCGSGILSVASARLGATSVLGIDVDTEAPGLTLANARRNGVAEFVAATNEPLAAVEGPYDVVVANILASTLRDLGADLVRILAERGRLILAGLLADQVAAVVEACTPLEVLTERPCPPDEGTWVCLTLARPTGLRQPPPSAA
jgi:ribosomal protein L11 methyltransferase